MNTALANNSAAAGSAASKRNLELSEEGKEVRMALQFAIIEICAHQDRKNGTKTSSQAIQALAELTFLYATQSLTQDLDAFSNHASRKTITIDDVKLMLRKFPDAQRLLTEYCDRHLAITASTNRALDNSSEIARGKRSRSSVPSSIMGGGNKRRMSNVHDENPPRRVAASNTKSGPLSRRLEFDLTSPNSKRPKEPNSDDSSTSSEDSIEAMTSRKPTGKTTSSNNKTIQEEVDINPNEEDDDDVQPLPKNKRNAIGKSAKATKDSARRVLDSSSDSSDDELYNQYRKKQPLNLGSISGSKTARQEKNEIIDENEKTSQVLRIMGEMSPNGGPSDDDSDGFS